VIFSPLLFLVFVGVMVIVHSFSFPPLVCVCSLSLSRSWCSGFLSGHFFSGDVEGDIVILLYYWCGGGMVCC